MTVIKQDDLIQSVADALQFISYYHPVDFIQAMHEAYLREESPAATSFARAGVSRSVPGYTAAPFLYRSCVPGMPSKDVFDRPIHQGRKHLN